MWQWWAVMAMGCFAAMQLIFAALGRRGVDVAGMLLYVFAIAALFFMVHVRASRAVLPQLAPAARRRHRVAGVRRGGDLRLAGRGRHGGQRRPPRRVVFVEQGRRRAALRDRGDAAGQIIRERRIRHEGTKIVLDNRLRAFVFSWQIAQLRILHVPERADGGAGRGDGCLAARRMNAA
jgi:hypothetical protein